MEMSKDKNYKRSLKRIYNPEEKLGRILGNREVRRRPWSILR